MADSIRPGSNPLLPLRAEGIGLHRDGRALLDDISFSLHDDRISVVLGPNGAGKSLLLRILCNLVRPDTGRVDWGGRTPRRASPAIGMVLQRPVMLRRSVRANLTFALARAGVPVRDRRCQADRALAAAGLAHLARQPAPRLSGGEAQRVAILRAWVQRPRVLVFDEPCANLDPYSTREIESLIREIHASGTRIVLTTHDLGQARRLADEVVFLADGRLHEHAAARDFFNRPATAAAAAFLEGRLLT
ncbi:MAG: ATP-binding cassette domain-containing protein [Wenzhouxiangellaceae bacterium]|nr:ATP-binding cassette domain-containing protein [Wenzhouxiangellaceae bacterium]